MRRRIDGLRTGECCVAGTDPSHLIESGAPGTSLGKLLQVLVVLGMESDLSLIAADDLLGRKLQDAGLTETRRRAPKRPKIP